VLAAIRKRWGTEAAFEEFVQTQMPKIFARCKRQYYGLVQNTAAETLEKARSIEVNIQNARGPRLGPPTQAHPAAPGMEDPTVRLRDACRFTDGDMTWMIVELGIRW